MSLPPKPQGRKYRNLVTYNGCIWIEKTRRGHRERTKLMDGDRLVTDWDLAARIRDALDSGVEYQPIATVQEALDAYMAEQERRVRDGENLRLSELTLADVRGYFREDGPLGPWLERRLDTFTASDLMQWWQEHVTHGGYKPATGRHYLIKLKNLFGQVRLDLTIAGRSMPEGWVDPWPEFSLFLKHRVGSTKGIRCKPIEQGSQVEAVVAAALMRGPEHAVFVLLGLDAGLRQGEALALQWGDLAFGRDESDESRELHIQRSLSRGRALKAPKSYKPGKRDGSRRVPMSLRLRRALLALRQQRAEQDLASVAHDARVVGRIAPQNWRAREWPWIPRHAGLAPSSHVYKDLRDTFASHLLQLGMPVGVIAEYLGHQDEKTTREHYARWVRKPNLRLFRELPEGEVPPDLLSRIPDDPHGVPTESPTKLSRVARNTAGFLRTGESSVRPSC
ncbi:MAG: site-specific integrase [Myxococcota bacterium]|nr:site-specific integrase [Myxococcota bacterium]